MSHLNPKVACLCPTFKRPRLLEEAIGCFLAQEYPAEARELIILDDAGQIAPQRGDGWEVVSTRRRFRSLPEKYNALAALASPDATWFAIWEDDDLYWPWHLSSHAAALATALESGQPASSKPATIRHDCEGTWKEEAAAGRFHASVAFTRTMFDRAQGWPITTRADFDLLFLARLAENGPQFVPHDPRGPSYGFRWGSTGAYHGQAFGPGFYEQVGAMDLPCDPVERLWPRTSGDAINPRS